METKSAQPERLRAKTLIFRFPAGFGTLRIRAGCRASSGLFPQPLLISCYSVVVKSVYHSFLAKSTIFRCAVQTGCTKAVQMRRRVWFCRTQASPAQGKLSPQATDEGRAPAAARSRVIAGALPSSDLGRGLGHRSPSGLRPPPPYRGSLSPEGKAPLFLTSSRAARRTAACKSGSRALRPADP